MSLKQWLAASFKNEYALLALVIIAALCLIFINYFTIKTLSAVRAYSNGESLYSKGQKDAVRNLIMFVNTEDKIYWDQFRQEINVPIGDSIARIALSYKDDEIQARTGFLAARNHPDDVDDLIWMFRNFKNISFMKKAIEIWKEGDYFIGQEISLGAEIKQKVDAEDLSQEEKTIFIQRINKVTTELTAKEREFLFTLGEASRSIKSILFFANVILTLLIIGSTFLYAWFMFKRLQQKNQDLILTNEELDKFVYSASHDLRSPIISLRGLVELAREEKNMVQLKTYFQLMHQSLTAQDVFLRDLIDFSRNKRTTVVTKEVDLVKLVDDVVEQHSFIDDARGIDIRKEIRAKKMAMDEFRLKIILNNLLSNAIKYSDPQKEQRKIDIRTRQNNGTLVLEVEDNGLGIKKDDHGRIFEMFFVGSSQSRGSGLGLYITHDAVQKLNGKITVDSEPGRGTMFTILLPYKTES